MLVLDRVGKVYRGKQRVVALDGVSLAVRSGEMIAIMGPSGSGKSTLLHLMGGLDRPTSGSVSVDGIDLAGLSDDALTRVRRDKVGFIFQFFNLLPTLSAYDNVALPLRLQRTPAGDVRARTEDHLTRVGLAHRAAHLPDELSGGECQRVAIARALVMRPVVLLADEPTGNLDSSTGAGILDLIRTIHRELSCATVLVTHDAAAATWCDRIVRLRDGRVDQDEVVPQHALPPARG